MPLLRWLSHWPGSTFWIAVLICGCSSQPIKHELIEWSNRYEKPCYVKVSILLTDDNKADSLCKTTMKNLAKDNGHDVTSFDTVNACVQLNTRYMIIRENPDDLWHEMRHIWDAYCLPMAPSANNDVNPKGE